MPIHVRVYIISVTNPTFLPVTCVGYAGLAVSETARSVSDIDKSRADSLIWPDHLSALSTSVLTDPVMIVTKHHRLSQFP